MMWFASGGQCTKSHRRSARSWPSTISSAWPSSTRKSSWSGSQWYIPIGSPGPSTNRLTPSCGNSASPSKPQRIPRPGRSSQRASRAFTTNQPSSVGTSPCSVCSSAASGTIALEPKLPDEPVRLAGPLGVVSRGPVDLLGYPRRHEAEQGGALGHGGLDRGLPLLERRRGAARQLVRALRAHARVAVANRLLPCADAPDQSRPLGDDFRAVVDGFAVQLHLIEDLARPEREVLGPARVDAAPAWLHLRLDPGAGTAVGQRPAEAREDAGAVGPEELVRDHDAFQSRNAVKSRSLASGVMSSSRTSPTASTVVLIWSTYQMQPSQKFRCCSNSEACSPERAPSR